MCTIYGSKASVLPKFAQKPAHFSSSFELVSMGCSSSKLDEEEAVKTCHDRRSFVKKAIAQRDLLASSHVAYVQSLRRVSLALFYYFAEDEHLYFLDSSLTATAAASCRHHPASPDVRKVALAMSRLTTGGAPVHPMQQWQPDDHAETVTVDGFFFGVDDPGQLFHTPSYSPANGAPVSPQPPRWDLSWDPFSSLPDHSRFVSYGGEVERNDQKEDEQMPELEDDSNSEAEEKAEQEEEEEEEAEEVEAKEEEEEAEEVVGVKPKSSKLRVLTSAEVEQQQSTPGFTVYVDRPPASMAEAMRDIQGHFMKIVDVASEVSVLLEVVPYQKKVQQSAPTDGGDGDGNDGSGGVPQEPFELFRSHKESLDRLYEWEKRLYEEVRAWERVRLSYEKKCAQLRSQDANGAEPYAIEKTRAAIRDLRTKLNISLTSADAVSRRIAAVRDDELLPQLMQLIRGLARMWRVIGDAHRVMKRTADEACALVTSSAAAAAAAANRVAAGGGDGGGGRGPPPPPGPARAATAAGTLGAELRGWRAAMEAWAESQRGYAAALWGWARSCVKDGEDIPRLLVAWARAVEAVDVDAATSAVEAVAAEAAAIAHAPRRRGGGEEECNEEEGKKKVCLALTAALASTAKAGGIAAAAYAELVVEMDEREREGEMAGTDEEPPPN